MMGDTRLLLPSFLLLLLFPLSSSTLQSLTTQKTHYQTPQRLLPFLSSPPPPPPEPTTFFEVTRPIPTPPHSHNCSTLVLRHSFANTYGRPPVTAPFSPCLPRHSPQPPSLILLQWSAYSRGRQFDRILGVWAGGVELLRSCTAEPRPNGILWSLTKDITRFSSLLSRPQTVAVHLANVVDDTYTGVYHVNLTFHFYWHDDYRTHPRNSRTGFGPVADLVLPVSRDPPPPDDGLWFRVHNSSDMQVKKLVIPRNSYRAVLEVFVSFHEDDEFWYSNPPNDYIVSNNLTGTPGNGPFREVVATVDGLVVGTICPFTVIHTGGINPLLWRPISGIGSFDLPSYNIEITPFLGRLLDGKPHVLGFVVTDALDVWYIDANLHLWLDEKSSRTSGKLVEYDADEVVPSLVSKFRGLDGRFATEASRRVSATGWVWSSRGRITTHAYQEFTFSNMMVFNKNGSVQVINQTIRSEHNVHAKNSKSVLYVEDVSHNFPLYIYTGSTDEINGSYESISNVSFAFDERKVAGGRKLGLVFSSLKNLQEGQGEMTVKGHLVQSGVGRTRQSYRYEGTDGCYFRDVRSDNYMILYDESGMICGIKSQSGSWGAPENKWMSFL